MLQIESTLKPRDVEEFIDIYFYRPVGYVIARISGVLALTPNAVTIIGVVVGMCAGHLFYYRDVRTNVVGILLLVLSEAMDSADGQLARMTNRYSRFGRILDGFGTNLVFVSIYVHLCLRVLTGGGSLWIFAVAGIAGLSHSYQSAMADYYRNAYLYFVHGQNRSELDKSNHVAASYRELSWKNQPVQKFLMRLYLNYTYQQESLSRNFQQLYAAARERFGLMVPEWLRQEYVRNNKPLIKYYNLITTNSRMIVLFLAVLIDRLSIYFAFELIVLNAVLISLTVHQEKLNARLLHAIDTREEAN
jgi:phosphatidylglycerophosphate synthase